MTGAEGKSGGPGAPSPDDKFQPNRPSAGLGPPRGEDLQRPRLLVLGRRKSGKTSLINLVLGHPVRSPREGGRRLKPGAGQAAPAGKPFGGTWPHSGPDPTPLPSPAGDILIHRASPLADFYELVSPGPGPAARLDCLERLENQLDEAEENGRRPHLAWLCLDAARGRFTRLDWEVIELIQSRRLPLALVLTKADRISTAESDALIKLIQKPRQPGRGPIYNLKSPAVFESSIDPALALELACPDRLIDWSLGRLGGRRRAALAGAARTAIEAKVRLGEECAARYAKAAALAGLSPLPLMDLAILVPIQTAMLTRLSLIWNLPANENLDAEWRYRPVPGRQSPTEPLFGGAWPHAGHGQTCQQMSPLPPLAGLVSRCAAILSRMLAGNLLKLWPGVGMLVGGLINVGLAGLMTWGLGRAVNSRLEKYARLALSGQAPPPEDFWDIDALAPLVELYAQAWDKYTNGNT